MCFTAFIVLSYSGVINIEWILENLCLVGLTEQLTIMEMSC